jgi:hypothetical protein
LAGCVEYWESFTRAGAMSIPHNVIAKMASPITCLYLNPICCSNSCCLLNVSGSFGELKHDKVGGVVLHWYLFVGMLFILPVVVFDDTVYVFLAAQFDVVTGLLYVHSIAAFNNAQVIQFILHVTLDLLLDMSGNLLSFGANLENIN